MFLLVSVILSTGGVCLSACWDTTPPQEQTTPPGADLPGSDTPREQTPPQDQIPHWEQTPPPPESRLQHTVNERPVRILLECILVPECVPMYLWLHGVATLWRLLDSDSCDEYGFPSCSAFSAIVADVDVLSRDNVVTRAK